MAYTLTIKDAVWSIDGTKITLPRDQNFDPVALMAVIDDAGNIIPAKVDATTSALIVKIEGGSNEVKVINEETEPVPVNVVGGSSNVAESILAPNIATSVPGNALTNIVTYNNATKTLWLDGFIAHGDYDAEFRLYIDNAEKLSYRTAEQDRTAIQTFLVPVKIAVGSIIDIKVIHFYSAGVADFKATIIGHKF